MLMPSPEIEKRLQKYETIDAIEARATKLEQRRTLHRRNNILRIFAGIAIIGTGASIYANDIYANKEIRSNAVMNVEENGLALDPANNDNAIVYTDGFNTKNADLLAHYMSRTIQPVIDGRTWSVDYNDAPLEPEKIADEIIEQAAESETEDGVKVTSLTFYGMSAGGDISMQVQQEVREKSSLTVNAIVLAFTPDGVKTLQQARQNEIAFVEGFAGSSDIKYSSIFRYLGEMSIRSDRFLNDGNVIDNFNNFWRTSNEVSESLTNHELPGTWLLFDQQLAIQQSDLKSRIKDMQDIPASEVAPIIIDLRAPGDYMVDNEKAVKNLTEYTQEFNVPFFTYDVEGAQHSRVDVANDQFIKVFADAKSTIQTALAVQEYEASLHRITSYVPYDPAKHAPEK